jgi:hypothetical protein
MSEIIKIQKTIYGLQSFNSVIDTDFTQLANSKKPTDIKSEMTVDEFFNEYDILFYDIPLDGTENSHLGLASKSLEYLGISLEDLQNEIQELREENINLKQQILLSSQINIGT